MDFYWTLHGFLVTCVKLDLCRPGAYTDALARTVARKYTEKYKRYVKEYRNP